MRDRPKRMTSNLIELNKFMSSDTRIRTPSNGSSGNERHNVIKGRYLGVRVDRLLYQRYTKSRGHYLGSNDTLFTLYPTSHILSLGIIGVDREVRVLGSTQLEEDAQSPKVVANPYSQSSYVSQGLTHLRSDYA